MTPNLTVGRPPATPTNPDPTWLAELLLENTLAALLDAGPAYARLADSARLEWDSAACHTELALIALKRCALIRAT